MLYYSYKWYSYVKIQSVQLQIYFNLHSHTSNNPTVTFHTQERLHQAPKRIPVPPEEIMNPEDTYFTLTPASTEYLSRQAGHIHTCINANTWMINTR